MSLQEASYKGHRANKVLFLGNLKKLLSTGTSRWNNRQMALWDQVSLPSSPTSAPHQRHTLCILLFKEGEGSGPRRSLGMGEGRWLSLGSGLGGGGEGRRRKGPSRRREQLEQALRVK